MRGSERWPWLAAAFLLCTVSGAVSGAAAGTPAVDRAREQPTLPARTAQTSELDPALQRVAAAASKPARALELAREASVETEGVAVRVILETRSHQAVRAAIEAGGGKVEHGYGSLVQALVPAGRLESLAARADVLRIERPMPFAPAAVAGEGIAFLGADRAQAAGYDGAGVSIAIFDWSFAGYPDRQASGDLPANVLTRAFCASGLTGGNGHGTAVAEIVHEIAPAAELHLVCINSIVELGRAADYAIELGIDVINMSGGFYNSGDGAGTATGAFAELPDGIARKARDSGIVWVNASGNEALTHWSGTLADPDEDRVLDFAAGDEGNSFLVGAGRTICAYARWRAWAPAAFSDFDLYVTSASGAVVSAAEEDQPVSDPTEEACFTNAGPTQFFSAALVHRAGDPSPLIDLFIPGVGDLEYAEPRGSLIEPAASPSVLTVGAVCRHTGVLQPYSSRGRETGPVKPDLVAPDAVSNATAGASTGCSSGFTGTSAAAPHVAGSIALLKDQFPGSSAPQLEALARAWARDTGRPNEDLDTGFGIARLVTDAPAVAGSTVFPLESGGARGTARVTSSVPGTVRWQYGPSAAYGSETSPLPLASSPAGVDVTDVLQFVPPGAHHARIVATNAYGTTFGPDEAFVAPAGAPSAGTLPAQAVSAVGATLGATASANGTSARVDFELGATTAYGTSVAGGAIGLTRGVTVTAATPALRPATTYHYRAVATNTLGQATPGRDVAFTTPPDVTVVPGAAAIGGSPVVGATLTTTAGTWSTLSPFSAPPTLSYQWLQCRSGGGFCAPINGAVGPAYAVRGEDLGKSLRVTVTGTVPWSTAGTTSAPTAQVTGSGGGGGGGGGAGAGGGGGSGGAPDVEVTLTASSTTPAPNQVVEVRVTVLNKDTVVGATGLTATLTLPADATLLGPPAFDRGSGCTGARTLVCFLDYLPGRATTVLRFSINVGGAGDKTIGAALTMNVWDPDTTNNSGALTLRVAQASIAGGLTPTTATGRTLTGRAGADVLRGTSGPDVIAGRGGNDRLYGGKGRDRLDGGAGNDTIYARDGARDVIRCGSGRDRVFADRNDSVARDCESVSR